MAATQIEFYGKTAGGKPFSFKALAAANQAVGTYSTVRLKGDAASTDSVDLMVPENVVINDIISSCASGVIRFESNGEDTYALVNLASCGSTNSGRNQNRGIPLAAGKRYRIKVETVLPA